RGRPPPGTPVPQLTLVPDSHHLAQRGRGESHRRRVGQGGGAARGRGQARPVADGVRRGGRRGCAVTPKNGGPRAAVSALAQVHSRVPPQNRDAERSLIGGLFEQPAKLEEIAALLTTADFFGTP